MGGGVVIATLAANNYGEIISHFIGGCVAHGGDVEANGQHGEGGRNV